MRRTLFVTLTVAAALLLAGCALLPFGNDGATGGGSDGSGGSGQSGGQDDDGQDGGGEDGDGQDGGSADDDAVSTGSGQLPAGWPAEVPVPDGEVVNAIGSPGSWVAVIAVDDASAAFAEVSAGLKAAGFDALAETTGDSGSIGVYENGQYQVQVLANQDSGAWTLTYTIVKKG